MALPQPTPGTVIRYNYLWLSEHRSGREEGKKDRPCAIVLTVSTIESRIRVTVLPVTHSPPLDSDSALEIPAVVKTRLGLDDERSWIVLTEANRFIWPGPDLRPSKPGDAQSVAYGNLPYTFFERVRIGFLRAMTSRRGTTVTRTE